MRVGAGCRGRPKPPTSGREEGIRDVARRLLAKGSPPAEVAEVTGLPLDDILKLAH